METTNGFNQGVDDYEEARRIWQKYYNEKSFYLRNSEWMLSFFGLVLPLALTFHTMNIRMLGLGFAYLIAHFIISVRLKNYLEEYFIEDHPKEARTLFG